MTKWHKLAIIVLLIFNGLILKFILSKMRPVEATQLTNELPYFTLDQLAKYDGTDSNLPVLLGMNGYIYDVSPGRVDFYNPGQPYNYIVGKDSSTELNLVGGDIIKRKYKIVGKIAK
ncbi:MAG: hypothetical protein WCL07_04495 [bacterium]